MTHPTVLQPADLATFNPSKMGKVTFFESDRILVGLNCFEPGQEHELHTHQGMDKLYHVLQGAGLLLLQGTERAIKAGEMVVTPAGVPHGMRNTSGERLIVLAVLAPSPKPK
jgi:quercetin dioxygenase-like cupin family protein